MNKLVKKISALSVGLAMAIGVGVAVGGSSAKDVRAATGDIVDSLDVKTFSGVPSSYTTDGTEYSKSGPNTSVTYHATGIKSDGAIRGNKTASGGNFNLRNSTTKEGYYISKLVITESGGTMDPNTSNRSVLIVGTSAFAKITNNTVPTGTQIKANESSAGTTLTFENSNTSITYFQFYSLKTSNTCVCSSIDITWSIATSGLENLVIKDSSGSTGPFNNLSEIFPAGYMFYAYDASTGFQKSVEFSLGDSSVASLLDNGNGSCCVTPIKAGTTKLFAEMNGYNKTNVELTFVHNYSHAGTSADPYDVADGIARCQSIGTTASGDWYVKGYISAITSTLSDVTNYGNVTFNLSDDPADNTNVLIAYQVNYIGAVTFTEETFNLLKAGLIAVVHGALLNYKGTTPEFNGKGNSSLVSLETPETGDVDVVFDPASTSYEIGDTGTFTATSETAGVEYSWESDNESVLSVNSETGAFEALSYGVAKVTVTASAGGKEGSTYALITVNGKDTMNVADAVIFIYNHGTANHSPYYIYVEGYVSRLDFDNQARGFIIMPENFSVELVVFVGKSGYSDFVSDLSIGTYIKVRASIQNYEDTLELTNPEKLATHYSHANFANDLLAQTDAVCYGWKEGDNNHDAIESLWTTLSGESYYGQVSSTEIAYLAEIEANEGGNLLQQAMARYDYLIKRYNLDNFIEGRVLGISSNYEVPASSENSNAIVIVIALTSVLAFSTLLLIKRKKNVRK